MTFSCSSLKIKHKKNHIYYRCHFRFWKAIAIKFAQKGHNLVITGRRKNRLEALKIQLEQEYKSEVLPLCFDVRIADAVYYVTTLPDHMNVNNLLLMPTAQASSMHFHRIQP